MVDTLGENKFSVLLQRLKEEVDGENVGDILSQRGLLMTFILFMFSFFGCVGSSSLLRLSLVAAHRYLMAVAAFVAEHGLWGLRASVVSGS